MEILSAINTGAIYGVFTDVDKTIEARKELENHGIKEALWSTVNDENVIVEHVVELMKRKPRTTKEYLDFEYNTTSYKNVVFAIMQDLNEYDVLKGIYDTSTEAKNVATELCRNDDGWSACWKVIKTEIGKPFNYGDTIAVYERVNGQVIKRKTDD